MKEVSRSVPVLCVLFSLSFGLLMNFLVPPFQSPDEPQHFSAVMAYAFGSEKDPEVLSEIIRIMDRNNWWRLVGMGRSGILPKDFSKESFLTFTDAKSVYPGIHLYHFLLGRVLKSLKPNQIIISYYICRFLSILLISFALAFIGMTFQHAALEGHPGLVCVPLFALFNPQFMLMIVSVNPDVLSIFLGAVFFYASFSILGGEAGISRFIILILAAVLAYFTDRSVYSLIILLIAFPFFMFSRKRLGFSLLMIAAFIVSAVVITAGVFSYFPGQARSNFEFFVRNTQAWTGGITWVITSGLIWEFIRLIVDSFYLKFGWMAFSPTQAIQWSWRAALIASWFGLGLYFIRRAISPKSGEKLFISSMPIFRQILFSLLALGLQLTGLLIGFGWTHILGQGRYFFPLMTAVALLFVAGIYFLFESIQKQAGHVTIGVFVLVEFFFLNYIIWNDIIPVFHLTIKSPHPGL